VKGSRNLETLEVLFLLEKKGIGDPSILMRSTNLFRDWPRQSYPSDAHRAHVAEYPEDLHLRLCVVHGGQSLRDKLSALLA